MLVFQYIGRESQSGIIRRKKIGADLRMKENRGMEHTPSFHGLSGGEQSPVFFSRIPQAKLTIGQPNDKYEQEADRVADQVMRMPEAQVGNISSSDDKLRRKCAACEKEEEEKIQMIPLASQITPLVRRSSKASNEGGGMVQTKTERDVPAITPSFQSQLEASKGGGNPLPKTMNQFMSNAFGTDFSLVRVHNESNAHQMNRDIQAKAFTHGSDIFFNRGQFSPGSSGGKKLLAHELAHVKQQGNGNIKNHIQQFSDTDHHIVEEVALSNLFTEKELKSIERGNMERDYSQAPAGMNAALLGNWNQFGGYKKHEHFDNFIFDREQNRWVSHDEYEKIWDDKSGQWIKRTMPIRTKNRVPKMNPLQYIESEFLIAVEKDMPTSGSFIHVGNAFHTIEDFFAHSNFVELTKSDYSAGKELTTQAPGAKGPESETSIFSNVFDVDSGAYFADKFSKELEKASPLSHGRLAKDFHNHPNHSMAIVLATLVIREVGMMLKETFGLRKREQRQQYVRNVIMAKLSSYFRPPSEENKWWEKLLAMDKGVTAKRIKAMQDTTPITVNQIPGSPLRNFEATKFSSWKAIGLGTSVSLPLKGSSFFTAGYMLYLPGTGSTLDNKIFVAPRSNWEKPDKPSIIFGVQISGSFDEMNLFKKGR